MVTTDQVWRILEEIPDPEIPVISIVDLGIAREVNIHDTGVEICITLPIAVVRPCTRLRTISCAN